ncbi:glycosyltransferase family 1 protein [Phyllobacterium brassicacearum]|uniref:Glycosyltransferase family 1 protein n=1 Tax=Phyllobacterium brassicacearum TaxID=314235 RepID=A0A2P7BBE3_9HYPH|nr:glycosyltransferase family 1 protein [Phyllobacterium brassicacearum]PSH63752.1 glycosyltransferase family 1 protein [Phyllobacterium brassicacearum]TDQ31966.1 glycosyltransferase involved in cell wall biosynthesis [Phyllobacterium brassicacearum]
MKIGIDARNLVPNLTGIGRYLLEMCRHLALQGTELILYLPEEPHSPIPPLAGATIRIANQRGAIRRMIWAQTELPRLAARDQIDVFWGPAHRLPFTLDRRIPRVVTIHDLVWLHAGSTMRRQSWLADRYLMKPAIEGADRIVTVSEATRKALQTLVPSATEKARVVYSGLTKIGHAAANDTLRDHRIDHPYALFVGTLEPRKNLLNLLEAYSLLADEIRAGLILVIAGGQGWHLGELGQHIKRLNIEASIRLTGYVTDDDLAALYSHARLLAMPSLYEGFGFPIIEANAMGVPVLTSNSSSMPEVAGDAALLVDPTDIRSISDGLRRLATDDALHQQLANNARANAARFDWEKSARELLSVFEEAIAVRKH